MQLTRSWSRGAEEGGGREVGPRDLGNDSVWRRENPQLSRRLRPREGGRACLWGCQPARECAVRPAWRHTTPLAIWNKHCHCSTDCKGSTHIGRDCMHMQAAKFAQLMHLMEASADVNPSSIRSTAHLFSCGSVQHHLACLCGHNDTCLKKKSAKWILSCLEAKVSDEAAGLSSLADDLQQRRDPRSLAQSHP